LTYLLRRIRKKDEEERKQSPGQTKIAEEKIEMRWCPIDMELKGAYINLQTIAKEGIFDDVNPYCARAQSG
jgi:hypothetical protein